RRLRTSSRKRGGETTTPLAMTERTCGRSKPVGNSDSLNVCPPETTGCPALAAPVKGTTKSCRGVGRSRIFALASSPHCRPTTQVLAMTGNLEGRPVSDPGRLRVGPGEDTKNARDPETAGANPDVF